VRIAQLQLIAYGPFRGLELDLSAPGVHVVFGRNEAGKSTTLRAIAGLLYGIDTRTLDAHLHKPGELRIGGTLVGDDGTRARVVRRKGVSKGGANTLLDESGAALDEAVVQKLLRGVSEETFRHAFGLDHETLKLGAMALLEGRGDIGGSLFDASVGGGGDARRLLAQLTDEADRLYKPRATAPLLNMSLKELDAAQKAIKEKQSLPEAYTTQREALEEAKKRRDEHAAKRAELNARRAHLARASRRVPLERKRAQLVALVASLGGVARHAARITSLHSRLGAYDQAKLTERDEQAESQKLRDRVGDAARRAGVPSSATDKRIDGRTEQRIQRLLQERATLSKAIETSRAELARSERELARLRVVAEAPRASDPESSAAFAILVRSVERARGLADTVSRHASEKAKAARKRQELEARVTTLGSFAGTLEELTALRVPGAGALDELAKRVTELDRVTSRHEERLADLDRQAAVVAQELAEASGDFAPPAASDLRAARTERDSAWARVRDARGTELSAKALAALDSELERATRDADVIADRMLHEADRVTRLASLRARQSTIAQQRTQAEADLAKVAGDRAALDAQHALAWAPAGIAASGLAVMRSWLQKHAQIVEAFAAVRDLETEADDTAQKLASACSELAAALGEPVESAGLVELLDRASVKLDALDAARRGADEAARAVTTLDADVDERKAALLRDETLLADARAKLAELVGPLGIPDDASADEVNSALESLRELFKLEDMRASAEARAKAAGEEARAFEEEAGRAAVDLAADLVALPARDVVSELSARAARALAAEEQLAAAGAELAQLGDEVVPDEIALLVADPEGADRALEEVDAQLSTVDADLTRETHKIGGIENGLAEMRIDSGAAGASADAQEALARVRTNVERYVRAKLGAFILGREIERYRQENQGPMLTKASQLFARLTLGGFTGVRAGYNEKDKPALKCVRGGNVEVDIEGLSEGTRDQLYLSLRIASLLRYADLAEPMPLVLDDVLIQFDDERSRAALQIIAELAPRMQVLFFTHHARLVELARSALPAATLTVHELASPTAETSVAVDVSRLAGVL
jgi:uncharacterized protein YhaN